ncbi:hypothetical protein SY88_21525 [Clostridiales bacterium PH28_bin88]|nr:hypothetical protein SY88_21525 [Clostridiales bacterium PH28_bin88]
MVKYYLAPQFSLFPQAKFDWIEALVLLTAAAGCLILHDYQWFLAGWKPDAEITACRRIPGGFA